ncbi:antigen peptide transporter 2 [Clupea harengus]|uniref:Antigen peptide transporter 2 n=1 Tax=Clupea harengus TaxID=7950 RepID=A0A6P3W973_CLUHA|nr:antigen peptide transporter 2 [Clupea harengus]
MSGTLQHTLLPYVFVLTFDAILWLLAWLLLITNSVGVTWLWCYRLVCWGILHYLAQLINIENGQTVLTRWVAALCLTSPAYEAGKTLGLFNSSNNCTVPDVGMVVLYVASASMACLLWEWGFPDKANGDNGKEKKKQEARALLMRVMRYSAPDYLYLAAAFLFLTLTALGETYIPIYVGKVIDILSGTYDHNGFLWAIGLMGLYSLGSSLFGGLRGGMFMCTLCRLNKRVRHMLFQNLMRQEINFFEENKPGSLSSRLISDTDKMGRSVAMNVNVLLRSLVKTVGMLYFMLGLSWELTLLACVEMPLVAALQNNYNKFSQDLTQQLQDCQAETREMASEAIGAVRTVRSFHAESQELGRYEEALKRMSHIKRRKGIYSAVFLLLRRMVTVGIKVLMLLQGRVLISTQQLSMGSLLSFVLYQKDMATNMKHLVYIYGDMLSTATSSVKVFQLLDRKPKMKEEGSSAPQQLKGKLAFHNVTFSYPSSPDIQALKNVTLEVGAGKMTALVGPSGGGKSSCVSLLQRFYEPQEGEVLLDGKPLHFYPQQYLHSKMAMVSQNPVLFSGSVRYNIKYGLKGCSDEQVEEAAKRANADNFICKLEDGYNTDVGECGGQLSSGQKQCIAIARALVRRPQILILDECTSSMDVNTQEAVQAVLNGAEGQTVLVIAHRLQTVERADHIIFMDNGEVLEQGTQQQLMDMKGQYYRLKEKLFHAD